jgi:hypothetical protein
MSKLDGYILSNSTYNAWAWFLNKRAYDIPVIAPKEWPTKTSDICHKCWTLIS